MHLKEAIDVLTKHNDWRRGEQQNSEMQSPEKIGQAMDYAIKFMSQPMDIEQDKEDLEQEERE